jgi:hypothetical protein
MITYDNLHLDQQKFTYNRDTKAITNSASGLALASENESSESGGYRVGKNIIAGPPDLTNPAQKFNIVYCESSKK